VINLNAYNPKVVSCGFKINLPNNSHHMSCVGTSTPLQKRRCYRLDVHHFFSAMGDEIGRVLSFDPVFENIVVMKVAILLIAPSLLISSLALLLA
jgi:hypothetical protein